MAENNQLDRGYHAIKVLQLAIVAALGGFLFGFDTAVINGAVNALRAEFELGSFLTGFAVSSALLGCMVGAFLAGRLADKKGRVYVMLVAAVLFVVSSVGSGLAFGAWDLIAWRMLGGLGVGAASVIAPAYIAEVSPAAIRGRMGSLQQLAIVSGIFVALLTAAFIAFAAGGSGEPWFFGIAAWRWMFLSEVIPAVIYGVMALTIPESPRYLMALGKEKEARSVLSRVLSKGIDERISEIRRTINTEIKPKYADLLKPTGGLLPIVWIGLGLAVLQQFVGINVIFYYSNTLWQAVGFSEENAMTITVITSVTNIVTTLVAIALIDKVGRKALLFVGSAGMALSLGTMAVVFSMARMVEVTNEFGDVLTQPILEGWQAPVALVAANLFVVFFGCSWGPVMWVMLGEMFNNKIRAAALGVAAAAQWLANFVVSTTFPVMADVGLWFAYGFYTFFALISLFFVTKFVPETKGKELEDM